MGIAPSVTNSKHVTQGTLVGHPQTPKYSLRADVPRVARRLDSFDIQVLKGPGNQRAADCRPDSESPEVHVNRIRNFCPTRHTNSDFSDSGDELPGVFSYPYSARAWLRRPCGDRSFDEGVSLVVSVWPPMLVPTGLLERCPLVDACCISQRNRPKSQAPQIERHNTHNSNWDPATFCECPNPIARHTTGMLAIDDSGAAAHIDAVVASYGRGPLLPGMGRGLGLAWPFRPSATKRTLPHHSLVA